MKLLIFGSTGSIGRHLVRQALDQGHAVTAFARNPSKIGIDHDNLSLIQGDAMMPSSVGVAVQGHDAVLCSIGAGLKGKVRSESTMNIINAMEKHGVRRLICQSTLGAGESWKNLNFYWKYIMFKGLLRSAYADHQSQEDSVRESKLEWTIVRPGAFTDGPHTGEYRHGFATDDRTTQLKISRSDVADFMLRQLTDETYLYQSPGLSY